MGHEPGPCPITAPLVETVEVHGRQVGTPLVGPAIPSSDPAKAGPRQMEAIGALQEAQVILNEPVGLVKATIEPPAGPEDGPLP